MAKKRRPPTAVLNGSTLIRSYLDSDRSGAFGKIGGTEGKAISLRLRPLTKYLHYNRYLRFRNKLHLKSGVFPETNREFERFLDIYTKETLPEMDGICSWRGPSDFYAREAFARNARLIDWDCLYLEPITNPMSWTASLKDKKVLVVSSFKATIPQQAAKIRELWADRPHLHALENMTVLPCPLYAHLEPPQDVSWSAALERMKSEMSAADFDVCLIAAGAWSLSLAVHAKKLGKIGIHMGGALQLLFGITGNRWEKGGGLGAIKNEHWCYPLDADTPNSFEGTEDAAYWKKGDA